MSFGKLYSVGKVVEQDIVKSIDLYTRACDGGDAWGCSGLGVLFKEGIGVLRDFKAADFYTKECDAGALMSCRNLGSLYEAGDGVKKDEIRATELFAKACGVEHKRTTMDCEPL